MIEKKLNELDPAIVSAAENYAVKGYSYLHKLEIARLPEAAALFCEHGFQLEMMTCVDCRESDGIFRLVYQFNTYDIVQRHQVLNLFLEKDDGCHIRCRYVSYI